VTNLVLNGADASEKPCKVRIFLTRDQGWAALGIEDWGTGIPEVSRSKVFDPFFTTKPVGQGTGLGLTVSLQLAQQNGGELRFESKPDGGTIFLLRLPLRNS
jgi:signal transduction histidine kinase